MRRSKSAISLAIITELCLDKDCDLCGCAVLRKDSCGQVFSCHWIQDTVDEILCGIFFENFFDHQLAVASFQCHVLFQRCNHSCPFRRCPYSSSSISVRSAVVPSFCPIITMILCSWLIMIHWVLHPCQFPFQDVCTAEAHFASRRDWCRIWLFQCSDVNSSRWLHFTWQS